MSSLPPVRKSVTVPLDRATAFTLFARRMHEWWPMQHRSITVGAISTHIEGRPGGRCYEVARDGREIVWGTVQAWEEPDRVVFSWHPGRPDSVATEVEVRFTTSAKGTRVDLEHRHWERLGADAAFVRGLMDNGWAPVLARLEAFARGAPLPAWIEAAGCVPPNVSES